MFSPDWVAEVHVLISYQGVFLATIRARRWLPDIDTDPASTLNNCKAVTRRYRDDASESQSPWSDSQARSQDFDIKNRIGIVPRERWSVHDSGFRVRPPDYGCIFKTWISIEIRMNLGSLCTYWVAGCGNKPFIHLDRERIAKYTNQYNHSIYGIVPWSCEIQNGSDSSWMQTSRTIPSTQWLSSAPEAFSKFPPILGKLAQRTDISFGWLDQWEKIGSEGYGRSEGHSGGRIFVSILRWI